MVRYDLNVANKWNVTVIYNIDINDNIYGLTKTVFKNKRTIIIIKEDKNKKRLLNTFTHEIKHAQSHICKYFKIDEDSESAAYLYGYIAGNILNFFIKKKILY